MGFSSDFSNKSFLSININVCIWQIFTKCPNMCWGWSVIHAEDGAVEKAQPPSSNFHNLLQIIMKETGYLFTRPVLFSSWVHSWTLFPILPCRWGEATWPDPASGIWKRDLCHFKAHPMKFPSCFFTPSLSLLLSGSLHPGWSWESLCRGQDFYKLGPWMTDRMK